MSVDEAKYAEIRLMAIVQRTGSAVTPLTSPKDLLGAWEMRFAGPLGGPEVQRRYEFTSDGSANVGDEVWQWELRPDGMLSFHVPIAPVPGIPGLEEGTTSEEVRLAFKAADGRVVLSNEDTSVIQLLSRATHPSPNR
jgi:hypothetical protein